MSLRAQISTIEQEILDDEIRLDALRRRLHALRQQAVFPIVSLPVEVTTEIFSHCAASFPTTAALLLSRVCRAWREIALALPPLWTTFCVTWDRHGTDSLVEFLETCMERAGDDTPLSVNIYFQHALVDAVKITRFMAALQVYSSRIRAMKVQVSGDFWTALDGIVEQKLPDAFDLAALEELEYILTGEHWDIPLVSLFRSATKLTNVRLRRLPPSVIDFSWPAVAEFIAQDMALLQCLDALQQAPNMRQCTLRDLIYDPAGSAGHTQMSLGALFMQPLVHHTLAHLTLVGGDAVPLLRYVSLPALETLEIRFWDVVHRQDRLLDDFLCRSLPPLRQLVLRPVDLDLDSSESDSDALTGSIDLELSPTFRALPLISLRIWRPSSVLADELCSMLDDPSFLPALRELGLYNCACRNITDNAGASVSEIVAAAGIPLEKRFDLDSSAADLESFKFSVVAGPPYPAYTRSSQEDLAPFERLRDKGMRIEIWEGPDVDGARMDPLGI